MAERDKIEIKRWMLKKGFTVFGIRDALGIKTHAPVSNTLAGRVSYRKVLRFFVDHGCPKKHLGLPKDMRSKQ